MAITASMVKDLRERTGAGMMDCKKALTATNGDMDAAIDFLREKGLSKAAKKASRVAAEGLVEAYVDEANKVAVLVEVNCETDFVANTDEYKNLVLSIAKHIAANKPADVDALKDQTFLGTDKKVSEVITEAHCQDWRKDRHPSFHRLRIWQRHPGPLHPWRRQDRRAG
jgi:elongation factor Ts